MVLVVMRLHEFPVDTVYLLHLVHITILESAAIFTVLHFIAVIILTSEMLRKTNEFKVIQLYK